MTKPAMNRPPPAPRADLPEPAVRPANPTRKDREEDLANRLELLRTTLEARLEARLHNALAKRCSPRRSGVRIVREPLSLLETIGEQESFVLREKEGRLRRAGNPDAADLACLVRVTVLPRVIERLRARWVNRNPDTDRFDGGESLCDA